jgi:hypothetical protein
MQTTEQAILEELEFPGPSERDYVERWRIGELERAGFPLPLSRILGSRSDVDLHVAIELIENGCPPGLAARILV